MPDFKSVIINNIMESVPIGLLVIDPDGTIVLSNDSAASILGFRRSCVEGRGWGELFFDLKENDDFNQAFLDVIQHKKVNLRRELGYARPKGDMRRLAVTFSFLSEGRGTAGIVVLLDDITDYFQTLKREKAILKEKNRLQKERVQALEKLALGVAHEIRNPSVIIGGFARRILKEIGEEGKSGIYVQGILSGVKRLEDIVWSVTEYASLPEVMPVRLSMDRILKTVSEMVTQRAGDLLKSVECRLNFEPLEFVADPGLLNKALYEVVCNAVDFMKDEPGVVEITAYRDDNRVCIEIRDNGMGVLEEDMPFVFDLFFSTKADGLGMGLPKAKRFLSEQKAGITVESPSGQGTRVLMSLPFADEPEKAANWFGRQK